MHARHRRYSSRRTGPHDQTRPSRAARHPDLVGRDFTATAPNQLWVTDLTFVPTWAGVAYVCLITDAFSRMIVGRRVAGHMRTTLVLDAIEMAQWPNHHQCGTGPSDDPATYRLDAVAELAGHPLHRPMIGAEFGTHHPHRGGLLFRVVTARCRRQRRLFVRHTCALDSKISLRDFQGDSRWRLMATSSPHLSTDLT